MRNETPLWVPTRTPTTAPTTDPERRLAPDKLCPDQQSRITRRIIRELP